jgi:hypothetical protein
MLAALAAAIWLLAAAGKKAFYSAVRASLDSLTSVGITYKSLDVSGDGILLRGAKAIRREDNTVFAEAKTVRLNLPLRELLKGKDTIKSLDVNVSGLRIYPRYDARGWDVERFVRELPKDKVSALEHVHVALDDSRVVFKLDEQSRKGVQQWLNGLYSKLRSDADQKLLEWLKANKVNLASPFGEDLLGGLLANTELVPPENLEIAFSSIIDAQPVAKTFSGSVNISSPAKGRVEFAGSGTPKIEVTASIEKFKLADLGFTSSDPAILDFSSAELDGVSLKLFYDPRGLKLQELSSGIKGVRFFAGKPAEIFLPEATAIFGEKGWSGAVSLEPVGVIRNSSAVKAGAKYRMEVQPISVNVDNSGAVSLKATKLALPLFIDDIQGVSADSVTADLSLVPREGMSGKLTLSGIAYAKKSFPGEITLEGRAKTLAYSGHAEWHVGNRTLEPHPRGRHALLAPWRPARSAAPVEAPQRFHRRGRAA